MTTNEQFLLAQEAVGASFDAHGFAVPAEVAYAFMHELVQSDEHDPRLLPSHMPREFVRDYNRIARERAAGNPFTL